MRRRSFFMPPMPPPTADCPRSSPEAAVPLPRVNAASRSEDIAASCRRLAGGGDRRLMTSSLLRTIASFSPTAVIWRSPFITGPPMRRGWRGSATCPASVVASVGQQCRPLSRPRPAPSARCAHRDQARHHGGRPRRPPLRQRRASSQNAGANGPAFPGLSRGLVHVAELVERCSFSMAELRYEYPEEICPAGPVAAAISGGIDLGRRAGVIRTACPPKCARCSSTSWR